jgi:hypothetical protein
MSGYAMKHALTVLLFLLVAACDRDLQPLVDSIKPPEIVADTIPLDLATGGRTLTATLTEPGSGLEITSVELRVARDRNRARFSLPVASVFPVTPTPQSAGPVSVTLPAGYQLARSQLLTAQWVVTYKLSTGTERVDVVSNVVSRRLGCTNAGVNAMLRAINFIARTSPNIPQTIANSAQLQRLFGRGYLPSHNFVSFLGMGVAFAHLSAVLPENIVELVDTVVPGEVPFRPSLLFYAPSPDATEQQVSSPLQLGAPLTLVGVAFARNFVPGTPPEMGCLPREAFFVHEAGWHMPDGGYEIQDVIEPVPGTAIAVRPVLPLIDIRRLGIWHGRLWDMHIWLRPQGALPRVSACDLVAAAGPIPDFFASGSVTTCNPGAPNVPPTGVQFPVGGFFAATLPP